MRLSKSILLFSCLIALLALGLQFLEYQYWIRSLSSEFYIGIIAFVFMILGLWLGRKWTAKPEQATALSSSKLNTNLIQEWGLSNREIEVLQLISEGYSNQEIADKLFVSLSTVKTHVSNLFSKLDVQRRTQAVKKVQDLGLLNKV
ncbi:MAG: response regulator transcription factor [Bacteroidota bacterium]